MLVASSPIVWFQPAWDMIPRGKTFAIVTPVALVGLSAPFGHPDRQSFDRQ